MDEYVEQFINDTRKKVNIKRRLPKIQYEAYEMVVSEPLHMADDMDDALLILDCIADVFKTRWCRYGKQEDANLAGHALMVASAFRSAETLLTTPNNHDILRGGRR